MCTKCNINPRKNVKQGSKFTRELVVEVGLEREEIEEVATQLTEEQEEEEEEPILIPISSIFI